MLAIHKSEFFFYTRARFFFFFLLDRYLCIIIAFYFCWIFALVGITAILALNISNF